MGTLLDIKKGRKRRTSLSGGSFNIVGMHVDLQKELPLY